MARSVYAAAAPDSAMVGANRIVAEGRDDAKGQPIMHTRILVLALTSALLPAIAGSATAGEIYRWVDDEGVTHYSQHPPADRSADRIETKPEPGDAPRESRADTEEMLDSAAERVERERLEREEAERLRQSRAERAAWCPQARQQLEAMRNQPRVRHEDEGYRLLTEEEVQARVRELQMKIERRCSDL